MLRVGDESRGSRGISFAGIDTVTAVNLIGLPKNVGSLALVRAAWLDSSASNSIASGKRSLEKSKPHMLHSFGVICRQLPSRKKEFCFEEWVRP
jgi:hypothetical protein